MFVNNDKIIVSVPDRKLLQYVAITPGVKMGSGLRVGDSCYSLEFANDKIYACFENIQYTYNYMTNAQTISKRDCGVGIYTVDRKVLKSITMMPIGEGRPLYLALNSDGSKIFYSGESDARYICDNVQQTQSTDCTNMPGRCCQNQERSYLTATTMCLSVMEVLMSCWLSIQMELEANACFLKQTNLTHLSQYVTIKSQAL